MGDVTPGTSGVATCPKCKGSGTLTVSYDVFVCDNCDGGGTVRVKPASALRPQPSPKHNPPFEYMHICYRDGHCTSEHGC